jgi:hypothetical protein
MPPECREGALTRRLRNIQKTAIPSQCEPLLRTAQVLWFPECRPCARCGCGVNNVNLGGFDGNGAMSGRLFCYDCVGGALPKNTFARSSTEPLATVSPQKIQKPCR